MVRFFATGSVSSTPSSSTTTAAPRFDSDDLKKAIEVFKHYSKFQNFNEVFDEIAKESPNLNRFLESLVESGTGEYHRLMRKMSPTASEFFKEVYLSTAAYGVEIIESFKLLDKGVQEEISGYYPKFTQFFKSKLFESVFYDVRLKKALEEEAAKKRASAKPKLQRTVNQTISRLEHSSEDIGDDDEDTIDPYDEEGDQKVDDIEGSEIYPEDD
ncbi:unnamed protein product [Bursaphelenchus xylophilus]|uniref:(pine wood nematode) hypothetical protein n=1 Tax=Bursaphelenchus xylophilus TaxID=6326 RepID=A0A811KH48_BURXY|nr:unnamed protein product [Bursaphelenchus xylophilus]CAG9095038.1 unnamed protein product [Bursaphelenchus xylophilus]